MTDTRNLDDGDRWPLCPDCGQEISDDVDADWSDQMECGNCGCRVHVERVAVIRYYVSRAEEAEPMR